MKPEKGTSDYPFRKATPEKLNAIISSIGNGLPVKYAAGAEGLTKTQFYNLINRGEWDLENGNEDSMCAQLVVTMRKMEKKRIEKCLSDIISDSKSHKGAEWFLERRYWRQFGSNAQVKELSEEIEALRKQLNGAKHHGKETEEIHTENETEEGCTS